MRVRGVKIRNYRTLEKLDLEFPSFYTAICGKNDSGKTNVVRALRAVMKDEGPYPFRTESEISIKEDFTKWATPDGKGKKITITVSFEISAEEDTGLVAFLEKQLSLAPKQEVINLDLEVQTNDDGSEDVNVTVKGKQYTDLEAQEVLKKLQSSHAILFYNSTELEPRITFGRGFGGFFRDLSSEYATNIAEIKENVNKKLRKITRGQQQQLAQLLGRLQSKYKVSLSLPPFDFSYLPYSISLGQGKYDVPLDEWGSGTRNRTLILLTLFRAREISQSSASASKITPCIVVEEPESFLHPSAQAEFSRVLQDLSQEFKVQVITTTHSPYMLSLDTPGSNVLLERKPYYGTLKETVRTDTNNENWMQPFCLALGIGTEEFRPWEKVFFSRTDALLLVEGDTDKEYFALLRAPEHGNKGLHFKGDIFAYGGKDTLKQSVMLKFVRDTYKKIFITFDLDAEAELTKCLTSLGLSKGNHFLPLGIDTAGKRTIEGLLPDSVKKAVHEHHPELVDQVMHGTADEKRSARSMLKKLYLAEFRGQAKPTAEYYSGFYEATKVINKALS